MARRTVTGQLNMFDFFSSVDEGEVGEVEMVSLVPNFDEEPALEEETLLQEPEVEEEPISEEPEIVNEEPMEEASEIEEYVQPEADIPQKTHKVDEQVAMSRCYEKEGTKIEIAYINYNKVRITKGNQTPEVKEFASTKEAVDFYVEQMQAFESEDEI